LSAHGITVMDRSVQSMLEYGGRQWNLNLRAIEWKYEVRRPKFKATEYNRMLSTEPTLDEVNQAREFRCQPSGR